MSLFELAFGDIGDESEEEEEDVPEPPPPPVYTCELDQALRLERMDLMRNHQKHKAQELEEQKKAIFAFLDGAQETLRGCKTMAPVKAFIRQRILASAPFCYVTGDRPLTVEQWKFIQNNGDSVLRTLHNTFNPYMFPAHLMLEGYPDIFVKLHSELTAELRAKAMQDTWRMIRAQLGCSEDGAARFVDGHPSNELNDRRLRKRLEDRLRPLGGHDVVNDMLASVPPGFMAYAVQNLADSFEEVHINPSRENSPERRVKEEGIEDEEVAVKQEIEDDEDDEEEEENPFELLLQRPPLPSTPAIQDIKPKALRSILKNGQTWYRSDDDKVRDIPLFGKVTYSQYSALKKKVHFNSYQPRRCLIYYIDRMARHANFPPVNYQRTGFTWGFKTRYSKYLKAKRYPNLEQLRSMQSAHTQFRPSCRVLRRLRGAGDWEFQELNRIRFPTLFQKRRPMRDSRGTSETAWEIPAHAGKREGDLGELQTAHFLLDEYYAKIMAFEDNGQRVVGRDDTTHPIANNVYGILILTDSILEDVNPVTLLNAALFTFPPPLESRDAVDILINCRELIAGMRDVVLSWGFEQLIVERDATEAFASLYMFAMQVKTVLEESVKKMAAERAHWDEVEMPRLWIFTIPEDGYHDADLLRQYNDLVRLFCADEPQFALIDWARVWSESPIDFYFVEDPERTERSLQLFFRTCRDSEMGLLFRRSFEERQEERQNCGPLGTGPWLKDVYTVFMKKEAVKKE